MSPTFLKLPRAALVRRDVVRTLVRRAAVLARIDVAMTTHAFAFKDAELTFARELLLEQSRLWLYRTSQREFAGDFVVVDVSSPDVSRRPIFAVELKRGERVREHAGTPLQLKNAARVAREIAETGVASRERAPRIVTGDARAVISYLRQARARQRDAMPRA